MSDPTPQDPPTALPTPPEVIPAAVDSSISQPTHPDQLPDYEPLTPELVEDEAIRGDFVIRWATILLAVLLGWTQVEDTSLLVRIRSAFERPLPFGTDTFSASAADRSWSDLAWLANPILAAAYTALGGTGLTLLGALTAGAAFWALSRMSIRGVSTWWGSICSAIALIAAFPHLTPGPAGISLLGTTVLLLLIHRWSEDRSGNFTWKIPAAICLWSQLDPEAWIGPAILLLFAISWAGLRGNEEGDAPSRMSNLWRMTGFGVVAWLIHPAHYHVLLSPWTSIHHEMQELQEYRFSDLGYIWEWFPVLSTEFGLTSDIFAKTSLAMCAIALLTFAINFKRLTWEWLLPWLGIVILAGFYAHWLPLAGIVSAALATLNAQLWYRANFSQEYTVDSLPLVWNRGGRAITVVSLLLLGIMSSNGMLMGRDGRRIGSGFSPRMSANIAGAEKLAKEVHSKEVFNFRLEQGDLLIWAGLKPYVDRRLMLFAQGADNLLSKHRKLRKSLLPANSKDPEFGKSEVWKAEFDRLHINQVIPRLSEPAPDYNTMVRLIQQGWVMSNLESFGAVLSRPDSPDEAFQKFLQEHPGENYVEKTFRVEPPKEEGMNLPWVFPRRPTVYDRWLWQPQQLNSEVVQLAGHEERLVELMSTGAGGNNPNTFITTTALALSAFRHARAAITANPQSVMGYQVLARAAQHLFQVEGNIARAYGITHEPELWIYHAIHGYHHALQLDPDLAEDHERLAFFQVARGKVDLALRHFQQVYRLTGYYTSKSPDDPTFEAESKQRDQLVKELKLHVRTTEEAVLKIAGSQGSWEQQVQTALQQQCPEIALRVMEENRTKVAQAPNYQVIQVGLLLDAGRTEDALTQASSLSTMIPQTAGEVTQPLATEIRIYLALASLAVGDNSQAEKSIDNESHLISERMMQEMLSQVPLSAAVGLQQDLFSASQSLVANTALYQTSNRWASLQLMLSQSELSTGRNQAARDRMKRVLEIDPDVFSRPLFAYYLQLLSEEEVTPFSPAQMEAIKKAQENAPKPQLGPAPAGAPAEGAAPAENPAGTPVTEPPPAQPGPDPAAKVDAEAKEAAPETPPAAPAADAPKSP